VLRREPGTSRRTLVVDAASFLDLFKSSLKEPIMDENESGALPDGTAPPAPHPTETLIERWWADHFPGSPVAQVTQAWNHAFAAKEDLKRRLQSFTGEQSSRGEAAQ
jgi:hypothetical protein